MLRQSSRISPPTHCGMCGARPVLPHTALPHACAACHMGGRLCIACALSLSFSIANCACGICALLRCAGGATCANAASAIATEHFCAFSSDKYDKRNALSCAHAHGIGCNGPLCATPGTLGAGLCRVRGSVRVRGSGRVRVRVGVWVRRLGLGLGLGSGLGLN